MKIVGPYDAGQNTKKISTPSPKGGKVEQLGGTTIQQEKSSSKGTF